MALRSIGTHAPRKSRLITQSRADYLLFTVRAPLLLLVTVHMLQNDLSHEYERGGERTRRLAEHSDQASLFWTGPYTLSINNNVKKKKNYTFIYNNGHYAPRGRHRVGRGENAKRPVLCVDCYRLSSVGVDVVYKMGSGRITFGESLSFRCVTDDKFLQRYNCCIIYFIFVYSKKKKKIITTMKYWTENHNLNIL